MKLTTDILWELKRGAIGFSHFDRECRGDFTAMATKIAASWGTMPPALQVDDLVQVMMYAVATGLEGYDPKRSGFKQYVVFRACSAARQELSRAVATKERDELAYVECDVQPAEQEDIAIEAQDVRRACKTLPEGHRQAAVINSLARTQSFDATTDYLLSNRSMQRLFTKSRRPIKIVSESTRNKTRHSIWLSAHKMAHRAQAATA